MARVCAICNKSSHAGNQVSHSHRQTRRSWAPNLQRARVMIAGSPRTINFPLQRKRALFWALLIFPVFTLPPH